MPNLTELVEREKRIAKKQISGRATVALQYMEKYRTVLLRIYDRYPQMRKLRTAINTELKYLNSARTNFQDGRWVGVNQEVGYKQIYNILSPLDEPLASLLQSTFNQFDTRRANYNRAVERAAMQFPNLDKVTIEVRSRGTFGYSGPLWDTFVSEFVRLAVAASKLRSVATLIDREGYQPSSRRSFSMLLSVLYSLGYEAERIGEFRSQSVVVPVGGGRAKGRFSEVRYIHQRVLDLGQLVTRYRTDMTESERVIADKALALVKRYLASRAYTNLKRAVEADPGT